VARQQDRIVVDGSHHHVFANPHGLVFEIVCFAAVTGCGVAGEASAEFTWFPGYRWRVLFCGACLTHLGWKFDGEDGGAFYGLIRDRLQQP
jgi:hypothetical protein